MRHSVLIILLCIATLFAGCSQENTQTTSNIQSSTPTNESDVVTGNIVADNEVYTITENNGQYYIALKEDIPVNHLTSYYPHFSTLGEMKNAILNNTFTEDQIDMLRWRYGSDEGAVQICDLDNLYEPTVPSDLRVTGLSWYGQTYGFGIRSQTNPDFIAGIDIDTTQTYEESFQRDYCLNNDLITIVSQETEPERNATVYIVTTDETTLKYIHYTITDGDKTLYIKERYRIAHNSLEDFANPTVPSAVQIWGTYKDIYFSGTVMLLTERPSLEWLSAFGIREYVETTTQ